MQLSVARENWCTALCKQSSCRAGRVAPREPVELPPDPLRGEFAGQHITHSKPPIPITGDVVCTDGGEGEHDGWTSQRTRTQVCVVAASSPAGSGPAEDLSQRDE